MNEAESIDSLLKALAHQTVLPKQTIIVDGGSSDTTYQKLLAFAATAQGKLIGLEVAQKTGNRSVGRNFAIQKARYDWIACTDAGCEPHPAWLYSLAQTAQETGAEVISGYYQGLAKTAFQEAVIPYALVMPDQVDPDTFLPATRSVLFTKKIWSRVGGFDELLNHNEDYAFARQLQQLKQPESGWLAFSREAVVEWRPPQTLMGFAKMLFRFAYGDAEAGAWRKKVGLLFARYGVGVALAVAAYQGMFPWVGIIGLIGGYLLWSVFKNLRYVPSGWYWLPVLQVVADGAVLLGTTIGLVRYLINRFL